MDPFWGLGTVESYIWGFQEGFCLLGLFEADPTPCRPSGSTLPVARIRRPIRGAAASPPRPAARV